MKPILAAASQETDLVDRARTGDREAEYRLYTAHVDRVHRLVYRLCGEEDTARDVTQDAFVKAFGRLKDFRGEATFGTWVHRIAVNLALNAKRGMQRRARWQLPEAAAAGVGADDHHVEPDLVQALSAAMDRLPAGYREVFVMHAVEGYTHIEIGEILGISEGTSKSRLFQARAKLRELLQHFAPGHNHA